MRAIKLLTAEVIIPCSVIQSHFWDTNSETAGTKRLESIKVFNLILSLCQISCNVAVNLNLQYQRVIRHQFALDEAEAASI